MKNLYFFVKRPNLLGHPVFFFAFSGAVINNRECAPHQHEMIDNYLVNARLRFDQDREFKAKQKQEQQEQHDKMKRDIYLNGGFVDCVNPGCVAQGTADTSYLCKSCYHEQMRPPVASKQPQQPLNQPLHTVVRYHFLVQLFTMGQKIIFYPKIHIFKITYCKKFTFKTTFFN